MSYSQFEELETFSRFGTRLDETTRHNIERGRRVREALKQSESQPLSVFEQIMILQAVNAGLFDPLPIAEVKKAGLQLCSALVNRFMTQQQKIYARERLTAEEKDQLLDFARSVLKPVMENAHENS